MKRTAALALAILLALTAAPSFALNTPRDTASLVNGLNDGRIPVSPWAIDHIMKGAGAGIIPESMYTDFTAQTSREEFCKMSLYYLCYATGKTVDGLLEDRGLERDYNRFTDTNDPDLLAAAALGVTAGTGANEFGPDAAFTRFQGAIFLRNICRLLDDYETENAPPAPFNDMAAVPPYAAAAVNFVYEYRIMAGDGVSFNPEDPMERQASVTVFSNMMGKRDQEIFVRESDGATFDPETDIVNGIVKPEVARALIDAILYSTHIYFDDSGQMWMDITFPELPKGWEWQFEASFQAGHDQTKQYILYGSWHYSVAPFTGSHTIYPDDPELRFTVEMIFTDNKGSIHIPVNGPKPDDVKPYQNESPWSVSVTGFAKTNDPSFFVRGGILFDTGAAKYLTASSWHPYPEEGLQRRIFDYNW